MKISVCIIAKNEEAMIGDCLASVLGADEIVVCDTGSTDRTVEVAKHFTDLVYTNYKWNDDFSEARNYAKSLCTGDWIFSIDADHILKTPISKLKAEVERINSLGLRTALVKAGETHWMGVLFKNDPDIKWVEKCHECLSIRATERVDLKMLIRSSPTHLLDPKRNLRILENDYDPIAMKRTTRNKFYYGRTLWEAKNYNSAIFWMKEYLKEGEWLAERAEAYYVIARCYWALNCADKARENCMKAIEINCNFKNAVLLMAGMSWGAAAATWADFSQHCTNDGVLFC